jgi:hypothetical protein
VTKANQLTINALYYIIMMNISLFSMREEISQALVAIPAERIFHQLPRIKLRLWTLCITPQKNTIWVWISRKAIFSISTISQSSMLVMDTLIANIISKYIKGVKKPFCF